MGAITTFDESIADEICARIASGETITSLCEQEGFPHVSTVYRWQEQQPSFRESYARARDIQADVFVSQTIDLSDRPAPGQKIEVKTEGEAEITQTLTAEMVGREISVKTPEGKMVITVTPEMVGQQATVMLGVPQITTKVLTADMVDRAKLRVESRRWVAARTAPHRYGDRLAHQMLDEHGKPAKAAGVVVIVKDGE